MAAFDYFAGDDCLDFDFGFGDEAAFFDFGRCRLLLFSKYRRVDVRSRMPILAAAVA